MSGKGVEGGCWSWRRNLFVCEVNECNVLLSNISLQKSVEDT